MWGCRKSTCSVWGWVAVWLCTWRSSTLELLRKLMVSSASFHPGGDRPEHAEAVGGLTVDTIAGTPMEQVYLTKSPNPDELQGLLDKLGVFDEGFTGWSDAEIKGIAAPTLITVGVRHGHPGNMPSVSGGLMLLCV